MNPLIRPRWLLHAEGAVLFAASIAAYVNFHGSWWLFILLLLAPDLSALGYLVNVRFGAICYNAVHVDVGPAALLAVGLLSTSPLAVLLALIWLAHIGMDRVAGYGLKYPTKFQDTHLQHV